MILNYHIDDVSASSGKASSRSLSTQLLPGGAFWPNIAALLTEFDPIQVRYAGAEFMRVVDAVARGAEQTADYVPGIQLLHNVILRLDPTSSTLTSTHYQFVRLCLFARAFSEATDILDRPIYHLPIVLDKGTTSRTYQHLCSSHDTSSAYLNPSTGLTSKFSARDYLEYHLYGGMIYMGLKQWEKAMFFLEVVLTAPTANTASMVMVEAYKKWLLVGLLLDAKLRPTPKTANPSAVKSVKAIAKPYDCLADAFKSGSLARLRGEIEEGQQFWAQDCNTGLVLQVFDSFRKFSVLRLGNTFAALSIAEVARRTSPDPTDLNETAAYVTFLITTGQLQAVITHSPSTDPPTLPILRFLPSSSTLKTESQISIDLAMQTAALQKLLKHVGDNDYRLEISKEYVDMLRKLKKQKEQAGKEDGSGFQGATFDDVDEDMMADL